MTTPTERTRAMLWAGSFLIELVHDKSLPLHVRRNAAFIARHFPTIEDVASLSLFREAPLLGLGVVHPDEVDWEEGCPQGPLRHTTRLTPPTGP